MGLPCMAIGYLTTVCNFYLVMGNIVFLLQAVTQKKIPGKFHYNLVLGGQHFCQPLQIKDIFQIIASASTAGLPALRKHFRKGNTLFKRLVT